MLDASFIILFFVVVSLGFAIAFAITGDDMLAGVCLIIFVVLIGAIFIDSMYGRKFLKKQEYEYYIEIVDKDIIYTVDDYGTTNKGEIIIITVDDSKYYYHLDNVVITKVQKQKE